MKLDFMAVLLAFPTVATSACEKRRDDALDHEGGDALSPEAPSVAGGCGIADAMLETVGIGTDSS